MKRVSLRGVVMLLGIATALGTPGVSAPVVEAVSKKACIQDSIPSPFTRIDSATCGTYGELISRTADTGEPIQIRFMVHTPSRPPKALIVLIAGGLLGTGITGDVATGTVLTAGPNFLVRSAQLFAKNGYLALTIHRPLKLTVPTPTPEFPTEGVEAFQWDHYRISAKHAFDIVRAVSQVNPANLPVFLAGTSRGALSVVGNHMLGNGILLSSPVTSGIVVPGCPPAPTCALYVNHPFYRLQPGFVTVPAHVMAHQDDGCLGTTPANALALHNAFVAAGLDSTFDQVVGGFTLPGEPACEALTFHGFLGVENAAVKNHTKRADDILRTLRMQFRGNTKPTAAPGALGPATAYTLDLATLTSDPGDALSYSLPYPTSYRGNPLSLLGSVVTYTPGAGPMVDGFTYVVSDGKGGITASYVIVTVP